MTTLDNLKTHYAAPNLISRIEAGLAQLGKHPNALGPDDLSPVDEFHVRGPAATAELITLLAPTAEMHVLDVGAGLGGPARRLARATGCRVTGVDLSESYCTVGTILNEWTNLSQQVKLTPGDATNLAQFQNAIFDAAWTIHVGMNLADKAACYREVFRVLKPGAAFVIYDVLTIGDQAIHFPVPWAQTAATSFLATRAELKTILAQVGFTVTAVEEHTTKALIALARAATQQDQQTTPPPLGLHLVLGPIVRTMVQSLRRNFAEQRVELVAVRCQKPHA
ncbi:MAG: class I SAM-dependent methyltransferase [Caldilineaceae bacterium]